MESFSIAYKNHIASIDDFLHDIFAPDTLGYNLLKQEVEREFRPQGSPEITQMVIDRIKYHPDKREGSFRVVLNISFTFACEDARVDKKAQTSEWSFTIDEQKQLLTCYSSPFIDSRSTADEF